MKAFTAIAAGAYLVAMAAAATQQGKEQPSSAPVPSDSIVQGCFSSAGELVKVSTEQFNSRGKCGVEICQRMGKVVAASTGGKDCYCGDKYPPKNTLADDKNCNIPCSGFGVDACGGKGFWTVYNTGIDTVNVQYSGDEATPSAVVTVSGGQTIFVTQTAAGSSNGGGGPNTAGIAAGVVVAVVAVLGILGGVFFFMRRRRNAQIEEEHRRNAAIGAFIHGGRPPSSSGGFSSQDSRLDPVMAQRRMSDGSIADNQDYSRKILRVTNA